MPFRAAANGSLSAANAAFVSEAGWRKPARQRAIAEAMDLTFPKIILPAVACQDRIARLHWLFGETGVWLAGCSGSHLGCRRGRHLAARNGTPERGADATPARRSAWQDAPDASGQAGRPPLR